MGFRWSEVQILSPRPALSEIRRTAKPRIGPTLWSHLRKSRPRGGFVVSSPAPHSAAARRPGRPGSQRRGRAGGGPYRRSPGCRRDCRPRRLALSVRLICVWCRTFPTRVAAQHTRQGPHAAGPVAGAGFVWKAGDQPTSQCSRGGRDLINVAVAGDEPVTHPVKLGLRTGADGHLPSTFPVPDPAAVRRTAPPARARNSASSTACTRPLPVRPVRDGVGSLAVRPQGRGQAYRGLP